MYLIRRKNKYLNERYQWTLFPNLWAWWQLPMVLEEAMQYKDRPTAIGELMADGTFEFKSV